MVQSHRHHYVPEWYQRRFLAPGQTVFKILDLRPPIYKRSDGTTIAGRHILNKGPKAHFFEMDLYTARWLGKPNDDIERMLFGSIDRNGQKAIDAYLAQDWKTVHSTYPYMYEFMDALRLRTPKGLEFVRRATRATNQRDLMFRMQWIRQMHCVMWVEGVLEIFSVADSPLKLIFSDHPVTLFNRYVYPADPKIPNGLDAPLQWTGTQTLFPFDQERLFVLTHLEWAQSSGPLKARKPRTNARFFDSPMVNYTQCIRSRALTKEQVREVNYIIKARAHRYIAGRSEEDLFPEEYMKNISWKDLARFLMPRKNDVYEFASKTYAVMKDGRVFFQDEFGQRPRSRAEYEEAVKRAEEIQETVKIAREKYAMKKREEETEA